MVEPSGFLAFAARETATRVTLLALQPVLTALVKEVVLVVGVAGARRGIVQGLGQGDAATDKLTTSVIPLCYGRHRATLLVGRGGGLAEGLVRRTLRGQARGCVPVSFRTRGGLRLVQIWQ